MNAMRRVFFAAMMMMFAQAALALELPDTFGEWRCVNEHVLPLVADANGEELGRMVWRDYERESPKAVVQVILAEGSGTGSLYVPEHKRGAKGVMPSEAGYEVVEIAGFRAVLETHEYLPSALAVNAGSNTVITIEGSENVIGFAENLLREISQ